MNFWRLQCFVALAEEQHFGRAANRLFVSQPALSQQIKQFEDSLGVPLVTRHPRFELTETGKALYPEAIRILELVNETVRRISPDQGPPDGKLQLIYGRSVSAERTFQLIEGFRDEAPSVEISAQTLWTSAAMERLERGLADAAFVRLPLENPGSIKTIALGDDEQWVVFRSDHPLAELGSLRVEDLLEHPLIHWAREDAPGNFDEVLNQLSGGLQLLIGPPQPDQGHRLAAVSKGEGYALVHESTLAALPGCLVASRVAPTIVVSRWGLAWDAGATHDGARIARSLGEYLQRTHALQQDSVRDSKQ
ncbi:MAG: hypothetical protein CMH38_16715 [Microbacterium sp.]|uniref:LysR family transcriptional regulator n=1 Tax=Microbacterium sp. TaxID=51671 RepID=UPI000C49FCD2|nr:LysR family transcriptional regulator [Microbacterium sp.]MAY51527.1 hypothetical protein [Microbacterium sp.]HAS33510.1 hypothetical protein [Microbacterium sp.]HBR88131.1 hypothetical protein [Microbacterium sp.]